MAIRPEGYTKDTSNDRLSPVEALEKSIKVGEEQLAKQRLALEFMKANPGYQALLELGGRY